MMIPTSFVTSSSAVVAILWKMVSAYVHPFSGAISRVGIVSIAHFPFSWLLVKAAVNDYLEVAHFEILREFWLCDRLFLL
jgi:hypothetical protein